MKRFLRRLPGLRALESATEQLAALAKRMDVVERHLGEAAQRMAGLEARTDALQAQLAHEVRRLQWAQRLLFDAVNQAEDERLAEQDASRLREIRAHRRPSRDPLVSIVVPTYNRADLLLQRSLPSALAQTYPRIEVVVVGDACTDDTEARVLSLGDPRIRFVNLEQRGDYPSDPEARWMVAGTKPANAGVKLAKGEWIAPLDDDDEFLPDHVSTLLAEAHRRDVEFVWGKAAMQTPEGSWTEVGREPLECGHISRVATMYRRDLSFMEYRSDAWARNRPGDWDLVNRMRLAGVRTAFVPTVVARHHRQQTQLGR